MNAPGFAPAVTLNVGLAYRFSHRFTESQRKVAGMAFAQGTRASPLMSEWFSSAIDLPTWFYILLSVGVLDALIQFSDYMRWRKDRRESEDLSD